MCAMPPTVKLNKFIGLMGLVLIATGPVAFARPLTASRYGKLEHADTHSAGYQIAYTVDESKYEPNYKHKYNVAKSGGYETDSGYSTKYGHSNQMKMDKSNRYAEPRYAEKYSAKAAYGDYNEAKEESKSDSGYHGYNVKSEASYGMVKDYNDKEEVVFIDADTGKSYEVVQKSSNYGEPNGYKAPVSNYEGNHHDSKGYDNKYNKYDAEVTTKSDTTKYASSFDPSYRASHARKSGYKFALYGVKKTEENNYGYGDDELMGYGGDEHYGDEMAHGGYDGDYGKGGYHGEQHNAHAYGGPLYGGHDEKLYMDNDHHGHYGDEKKPHVSSSYGPVGDYGNHGDDDHGQHGSHGHDGHSQHGDHGYGSHGPVGDYGNHGHDGHGQHGSHGHDGHGKHENHGYGPAGGSGKHGHDGHGKAGGHGKYDKSGYGLTGGYGSKYDSMMY